MIYPSFSQSSLQADCCPICEAKPTIGLFKVPGVPIQDAVLYPTQQAAWGATKEDICLTYCASCHHVYNKGFDPTKLQYHQGYNITLHHSPLYRQFTDALASELVERYALRGKTLLEIACGKGEFLQALCRFGSNRGIGIDPSYEPASGVEAEVAQVAYIRDFYSDRYAGLDFDFMVCRHALDDMLDPKRFLGLIRKALNHSPKAVVYFEVPNAEFAFAKAVIWNLIYENSSYFGPSSLRRLFELSGFKVLRVCRRFEDDQYLSIEATADGGGYLPASDSQETLNDLMAQGIETFSTRYRQIIVQWTERLDGLRRLGRRVTAWGAGARAVSFFNVFQVTDLVPCVVDINPQRQGKYLPGTAQLVVAPDYLRDHQPDLILITNPTFEREIKSAVHEMGLSCDFLSL